MARTLRDLHARPGITLVLVDIQPLADNIRRLTVPLQLKLPDVAELEQVVRGTFREIRERSYSEVKHSLTQRDLEQMVQTLRGLTAAEAARVIAAAIHDDYALTPDDLPRIVEHKRNLLQSTGCLESIAVDMSLDEIGGLDNLKRWLAKRRGGMTTGRGRSAWSRREGFCCWACRGAARACVRRWWRRLGDAAVANGPGRAVSEVHRREREPAARGAGSGRDDGPGGAVDRRDREGVRVGVGSQCRRRVVAADVRHAVVVDAGPQSPIFMVATANNIAALPPELMRKGRFDEVFFVDLPDAAAREQILAIHLRRRKREPAKYRLVELAKATDGFSGAELEQAVVSAMYAAFAAGVELTDAHLLDEVRATRPLSVLMREQVVAAARMGRGAVRAGG